MMTKKTKEAAVKLEPVEVVELAVEEDIGFEDVPFIRKKHREGVRKYQHDPKHAPIVEIAGKVHELKEVDKAEVLSIMDKSRYIDQNDDLTQGSQGRHSDTNRWNRCGPITLKDITFKHVSVDGVDIYVSNGSELIITNGLDLGYYHDQIIDKKKPSIILLLSRINTKNLNALGKNVLINSTVTVGESVSLLDAGLTDTIINGHNGAATIDDSTVLDSSLNVSAYVTITDSKLTGARIYGLSTLTLDRVSGGHDFTLSLYTNKYKEFNLAINNQYIHSLDYHHGVQSTDGYTSLDDFPRFDNGLVLNIEKRVDFGYFAAVKSIPFIRLNQFDLLVGGEIFSVKEFFPELIDENAQKPTPVPVSPQYGTYGEYSRPGGYAPPQVFPLTPGYWSRSSEVWKRAARVAFDTNGKKVIGKTGELIINSLLDQIKSRINLYVELNTLR